ncbi:transglutaminaseTgpA domain-containing protein [Propionibacteriaceae bacterium Y2011]
MRTTDRLAIATGVAMMLATFTLLPITQDRSYLGWSFLLIVLVCGVGAVLRRTRWGDLGATSAQLVTAAGFLLVFSRLVPRPGAADGDDDVFVGIARLAVSATEHLQTQSAPMESHPGVLWLTVAVVGALLIMTDLLVCTLQRYVWGFAPPLALFLIPALSLQADLVFFGALAIGVGYLGILLAENVNRADRWRRGVLPDERHPDRSVAPVLWGSAALVAIPALVLAMIGWLVIPTGSLGVLGGGTGQGEGGPLQLGDPTLDLRRNLTRPDDVTILSYQTSGDDSEGVYLRMASLPHFDGNGWQNAPISVLQGQPGAIPGVAREQGPRRTTSVQIGAFGSEYLPLPYAPRQLQVPGEWGYDPLSLVYIATGEDRMSATRGLSYTVQSADIVPDGEELTLARTGVPQDNDITGTIPQDLPDEVVQLAFEVTEGRQTPALQAAAIQSYLRSGEFEYSTEPAPGTGYEALTRFLFQDKRGYCEQFAAAMAIMARAVGIPSRVAIGFLPGERNGDTWEVSTHDMHSWPELYFDDIGWVRWEPTPGNNATPPAWTVARQGGVGESTAPSASSTTEETTATNLPSESVEVPTEEAPTEAPIEEGTESQDWVVAIAVIGVVLLLLALAATPAVVRARRRRHRLSGAGPPAAQVEDAWHEIRDTVLDHRGSWPSGSPRAIGSQVGKGLGAEETESLGSLALMVERSRYSRGQLSAEEGSAAQGIARQVVDAMARPTSVGQRIRNTLLPRSLWRRPGGQIGRRGL